MTTQPILFDYQAPPSWTEFVSTGDLGRDMIEFIEGEFVQFEGPHAGEPFELLPWQRRATRGAYAGNTAAISVPRSAGKSHWVAALLAATVTPGSPRHEPEREAIVVARRFDQAAGIVGRKALRFLRPIIERHPSEWSVRNSSISFAVEHKPSGARLVTLSADPGGMLGHGGDWFCDEAGHWQPTKSDAAIQAILSGGGKLGGERVIAISTLPADPSAWFYGAVVGGDWDYAQLHKAEPDDPPFRRTTWRKANPSLAYRPELMERYVADAARAKVNPDAFRRFQHYGLNLANPVEREAEFVDAPHWLAAEGDAEAVGEYVLGLDLAEVGMAAAASYHPATGRLDAVGFFPSEPSLARRGLREGVGGRFEAMAQRGELLTAGREAIAVHHILDAVVARWGGYPAAITCDNYGKGRLLTALRERGWPPLPLIVRHNGFGDGHLDTTAFLEAFYAGRVVPVESLLLRHAVSGSRLAFNHTGNQRLVVDRGPNGGRGKHRDDAIAASVLAVAAAVHARRVPGLAPPQEEAARGAA